MWRSDSGDELDDGSAAPARLARVTALPDPDPDSDSDGGYPWDRSFARDSPGAEFSAPLPVQAGRGRSPLAAFDAGRRGVRVLLLVGALVVCASAAFVWFSRPHVTPAPPAVAASAIAPATTAPAMLVVSVTGRVNHPGLVRLPAGARVADAIEAAGGAQPGVDLTGVNLARKVVDGEMIAIGVTPPPPAPGAGGPAVGGAAGGPVNLNTATAAELQTLPGIGEVLAQRIVDFRDRHGGFRAVSDLRQVEGIGDAKYQQLKDHVTV